MIHRQIMRFVVVGVLSTIVNYTVFYVSLRYLIIHYMFASAIGFCSGVLFGYGLNKKWTFQVTHYDRHHLTKYFIVYISSLILSLLFLKVAVEDFGIIPELANILAIGLTTCTNFLGIKFWVFRS